MAVRSVVTQKPVARKLTRKKHEIPAVVFGHGVTHLGVIRNLAAAGIRSYSVSTQPDFVSYSRHYRTLPVGAGEAPAPPGLPEILRAARLERAVLIPCTDDWLRAVASLPSDLTERFPACVPPQPLVEALLDKWRLAELLEREGIPHPRTVCLHSLPEAEALPEELFIGAFLKPRDSLEFSRHYKVKALAAENREQALHALGRVFGDGFSVVLQEYIPGPSTEHFFVEGFVDRKGRSSYLARQRLRMHPPRFGNSTYMISISRDRVRPALESLDRLFSRTAFRGMLDAEFKYDKRDGQFKLIEINARPWWQLDFAEHCGLGVSRMSYWDALGYDVEPVREYAVGRRGVLLSKDFFAYLELRKRREMSLWSWLGSWLGAHDLVFQWNDPVPALAQLLAAMRRDAALPPSGRSSAACADRTALAGQGQRACKRQE